jgi:hypothetical protein
MLILSAEGLTTFTSAEPPEEITAGLMVSSTGSGPGVRSIVEVDTPQP